MMKFHILTLFPEMVQQGLATSILGRAAEKDLISIDAVNIRDYTQDKHGKVDDYTYGGGAGMLMQAQPVYDAYRVVAGDRKVRCVYLTPQGAPFTQKKARELPDDLSERKFYLFKLKKISRIENYHLYKFQPKITYRKPD